MDKPKSLESLFKKKIFRVPNYQRGYAWQISHLKDFWEDLINLSGNRSHYTGVLTLTEISPTEVGDSKNEYWLVKNHSYKMYHIVDGQQRLTTFVVFLQAFIDFIKQVDENADKSDKEIYIRDNRLSLEEVISYYLYKTKPTGAQYRTYKFGYTVDNLSDEYLRHGIFNEEGPGSIKETFYTLNLRNAKQYFCKQLKDLYAEGGLNGLQDIYKKLTEKFLFNEFVIKDEKDEIDVFVAFETMNNRGKQLSDLELLKNRLIYLTTLYTDKELDAADHQNLIKTINEAWKEVYDLLGRNAENPLNDDDFLKAHWIMYFQYSRKKGNDYIKFLLDEQFSPQKIHEKNETGILLKPHDITQYVNSLKESAVHWFNSHYPHSATKLLAPEKNALDRLNRIGMGNFRPLVMSVLKNEKNSEKRTEFLVHTERFIFIVFRLSRHRSNLQG